MKLLTLLATATLLSTARLAAAQQVPPGPLSTGVVHVDANGPGIGLERRIGDTWMPLCASPCDRTVPTGEYRLGGRGLRPTAPFRLASSDPAVVRGSLAPAGRREIGVTLTILGTTLTVGAGTMLGVGALLMQGMGSMAGLGLLIGGITMAAGGLATLVPGIVLLAGSGSSASLQAPTQTERAPQTSGPAIVF